MFFSTTLIATLASLPFVSQLASAAPVHTEAQLAKRDYRATWYDTEVGLGGCGKWHANSEYTVALNSAQFGNNYPSDVCGKSIWISSGGKTVEATIQDACPTCPYGALDLSKGLFQAFDNLSVGVLSITWGYSDSSSASSSSSSSSSDSSSSTSTSTSSSSSSDSKDCKSSTFTIFDGDETLYSEPYFTTALGKTYLYNWAVKSNLESLMGQADSYCRDGIYHTFDGNTAGVLSHFDF